LIPEALNDDLYFNLDRSCLMLRRYILDALAPHNVSPEQWEVLQYVDNHEGISQAKLTSISLKDKGNISRIVARMIRYGWVRRNPEKPRGLVIRLTSQGRIIKDGLPGVIESHTKKIFKHLSKDEQQELVHNLKKLRILLGDDDVLST
jgi:DNA-binding MarR family transcriptional regulator